MSSRSLLGLKVSSCFDCSLISTGMSGSVSPTTLTLPK